MFVSRFYEQLSLWPPLDLRRRLPSTWVHVRTPANCVVVVPGHREAYKTFERALHVSLEDPRFGIGMSREAFEEPFKGSIGSGANRTAMYVSSPPTTRVLQIDLCLVLNCMRQH